MSQPTHAVHGPEEAHLILKDKCERCAEHALAPWKAVDRDRLDRLTAMALRDRYGEERCEEIVPDERGPLTQAEEIACGRIIDVVIAATALTGQRDALSWFSEQRSQAEVEERRRQQRG